MDKSTWIYALSCPIRKEVRYVGQSQNPAHRFRVHKAGGEQGRIGGWMRSLAERGLSAELELLEQVAWDSRYEAEAEWIHFFDSQGCCMTNMVYQGARRDLNISQFKKMGGTVDGFGERLRALRNKKGMSQTKLAARADLNPATVSSVESGKRNPSPLTARKLARALNVDIVELLDTQASAFILPTDTVEKIEKLAASHGVSEADVVMLAVENMEGG